jgi:hypothetical protein
MPIFRRGKKERETFERPEWANCSYGEKINTGNYCSVSISYSFSRAVEPDEKPEDALRNIFKLVKDTVEWTKQEEGLTHLNKATVT